MAKVHVEHPLPVLLSLLKKHKHTLGKQVLAWVSDPTLFGLINHNTTTNNNNNNNKEMPLTELMLISVPGDPTPDKSLDRVHRRVKGMANMFNMRIPKFKVGTLDQLVALSESLSKFDADAEAVTHKVAGAIAEVERMNRHELTRDLKVDAKDVFHFVSTFDWDHSRFPLNMSVKNLSEAILKQYEKIGSELDKRLLEYRGLKKKVEEKNPTDASDKLTKMNLQGVVKKHHMIESENLVTALVVVQKSRIREWTSSYESLGPYVVPRSLEAIYSDGDNTLFGITIFKKYIEDFKHQVNLRHHAFRHFEFVTLQEDETKKTEFAAVKKQLSDLHGGLLKWLRIGFSESFICWMHLKVLRLFVESVLRYGLPVNFTGALLEPLKKSTAAKKTLLHAIDTLFADTQDTLSRQKLSAKDIADYPSLKDMIFSDDTLEYSFILFLFSIEVP
ncbi:unnamed protein product [Notodromas monacha]|uniref:V-type proton ATPase subunit C n=1 Tax=Notodromas monacha TaxID=399045 RepID=A0A7R9GH88_9CRUS|nr:unnamed protein product [Notodromas monacha]CAG0922521.1 unnamed protein product [Notodromas monacha]